VGIVLEEYAKVGHSALVYWEHELRDPQQRERIREEIKAFIAEPHADYWGSTVVADDNYAPLALATPRCFLLHARSAAGVVLPCV
jgi:hypothetical protein